MAELVVHGQEATVAGRSGIKRGVSAFGPTPTQACANASKRRRHSIGLQLATMNTDERAVAVAQQFSSLGVPNVKVCVETMRVARKTESDAVVLREEGEVAKLHEYLETAGAPALREVSSACPALDVSVLSPLPAPPSVWSCTTLRAPSIDPKDVVAWLESEPANATNLGAFADACMAKIHATVQAPLEAGGAPVSGVGKSCGARKTKSTNVPNRCCQYGVCVCSANGKRDFECHNRFLNILKQTFPNRTDAVFKLLLGGHFFARVFSPSNGSASSSSDVAPLSLTITHMWHIGLMYLNPYRPTFQCVDIVGSEGEVDGEPIRIHVQATGSFLTELVAIKLLDKARTWTVTIYQVEGGPRPIGTLRPNLVSCRRYGAPLQLWPRPKRRVFRAPRVAGDRPLGPADADDLADDNPGDGDEPDEALVPFDAEGEGGDGPIDDDELDALVERMFEEMMEADDDEAQGQPEDVGAPGVPDEDPPLPPGVPDEDPPLPPPLEPPAADVDLRVAQSRERRGGVDRAAPEALMYVTGGCVKWYRSKNVFEAHCDKHPSCVLSRSSTGGRRLQQGRCLGMMACWLRSSCDDSCSTKALHWSRERLNPSRDDRIMARDILKAMHTGRHMLMCERPKRVGEDSEPEDVP
jgi:hypothetical protein